MYVSDLALLTARTGNLAVDCDKLCSYAARDGASIEITQALLAASWSVRAAKFALQLAIKQSESNGTLGPSPSRIAATGS